MRLKAIRHLLPIGLLINQANLNRTLSIQMHIPLGEGDNDVGCS
jgi:hypothetical protein